ncbi:hypothetical protein OIU77_015826 [Salix suchowensis]|uniref:Nuclease associated modular domain-containing protein n=1 Tax=Salix suchowensis TaxID=1278906 RepID=A0ABQ8ZIQ3_9ROSI|nr:hypothetical protein OIU77_015826 [Salix suchowensis]
MNLSASLAIIIIVDVCNMSNSCTSIEKKICPAYASISTFPRIDDFVALQIGVDVEETTGSSKHYQSKISLDPAEKQTLSEEVQLDGCQYSAEKTRALIKQRTIEALTNPQVRKKMSGHPRAHSEAIRTKIRSSLRQLWGKRLKLKRLRERFFMSWSKSIARAAKEGGIDQQELDWDGYDKIKKEITLKQLQGAMERAKGEEIAKRTAEREAKKKEEKMERVAQKRKEREEKAMEREETKRKAHRKSKKNTEESSVDRKLTLKKILTKIRKKKSTDDQMISHGGSLTSPSRAWEKLNAEIKKEKVQGQTSLADQIQAIKNKKTESNTREALAAPSTPPVCWEMNTVS